MKYRPNIKSFQHSSNSILFSSCHSRTSNFVIFHLDTWKLHCFDFNIIFVKIPERKHIFTKFHNFEPAHGNSKTFRRFLIHWEFNIPRIRRLQCSAYSTFDVFNVSIGWKEKKMFNVFKVQTKFNKKGKGSPEEMRAGLKSIARPRLSNH